MYKKHPSKANLKRYRAIRKKFWYWSDQVVGARKARATARAKQRARQRARQTAKNKRRNSSKTKEKIGRRSVTWTWGTSWFVGAGVYGIRAESWATYKYYNSGTRVHMGVTLYGGTYKDTKFIIKGKVFAKKRKNNPFSMVGWNPKGGVLRSEYAPLAHRNLTLWIPIKYGRPYKNVFSVGPAIRIADSWLLIGDKSATMGRFKNR